MITVHFTPLECHLLPSLCVVAGMCDNCEEVHVWQVFGQFLWWGFTITFGSNTAPAGRGGDHEHEHELEDERERES